MKKIKDSSPKYYLNDDGEFVIENFNYSKQFANFFPGIAGKYGIPMWTFYVNRGQAISCFGTRGKAHAFLEFFPAYKAWQLVTTYGFFTFIKVPGKKGPTLYEPFHNGFVNYGFKLTNRMRISTHALILEEENFTLGLSVKVEYFNIPNDSYAGLARIVTVKNLGKSQRKIQLLDGLPQVVPYGTNNLFLKQLGRTIEAWMHVDNLENGVPYFKLSVDPTDRPEVIHIKEGNFYLGFTTEKGKSRIIKPVVDPECVFGPISDFSLPKEFLTTNSYKYPKDQILDSKMPCAFLPIDTVLPAGESKVFYAVAGYMRSIQQLNSSIKRIACPEYILKKKTENKEVIDSLKGEMFTRSSCPEFDLYSGQNYIDNIMRGGYPEVFKFGKSEIVYYLYSRKHGDLERDYNRFAIQPAYFSQGNGNYRDINQNRRCDTWFNPEVRDENLVYFFNLLQIDGFNPLIVKGASFIIKDENYLKVILKDLVDPDHIDLLRGFLSKPFTPGDLVLFIEEHKIKLLRPEDEVLKVLLSHSLKTQEAEFKEGFWTDHWAYNLDLIDNYLAIYPEKLKELLFEKKVFTFYDNAEIVNPRAKKYTLYNGKPRQLRSLAGSQEKIDLILSRKVQLNVIRTKYGKGDIYQTTLINKLVCLFTNKIASLDASGVGIEMEANKPNWYDALNGLPALFGSSLCETQELKRLVIFMKDALSDCGVKNVAVNEETAEFLRRVAELLKENVSGNNPQLDFLYWDKSYALKEDFREKTKFGFSGSELLLESDELVEALDNALIKLDRGIEKARSKDVYLSYFINEVVDYEKTGDSIRSKKFSQKPLPLFLESQVHALRLIKDTNQARALYKAVKSSELFDKELKMYKVTAPLGRMPEEIGRCRVFTPGWLENESIWLHMEYKYLLELLKCGLYEEFYADFKNVLVPFQDPQRYGRNILENSSFLVSSAFPDKKLHGNGYVARLSGSTAEFVEIWLNMNIGNRPFNLDNKNRLNLTFSPKLAGWLFDKKGKYSFNFLGVIPVTYHNRRRKNTFGKTGVKPAKIIFGDLNNKLVEISSDTIPSPYAEQVRLRQIKKIDIYLG